MEHALEYILGLALIAFLVFLNGFFVAAEFAIVKVRSTQLEPMIAKGHRRAKIAGRLLGNLDAALSATQLGITLASLGLGWVGEPVFARMLHPILDWMNVRDPETQHTVSFIIGFTAITFLHIVLGELAPKSMAIQKPVPVTTWVAQPLEWFYKISYPAIWALNHAAMFLLRRVGIQPASESELVHSQEELRLLFTAAQEHSGGTALGRAVVLNALNLSRREAREVMRPRGEITVLDTEAPMAECLEIVERTRYSRFPLCEGGDLDKTIGVVHMKDLYALRHTALKGSDLRSVARKIVYVPPSCRLERLLQLLLERKLHFSIVVDEFGGTLGLVTLENILEELVGQIQDEFDQEKPLIEKVRDQDAWLIDGTLPLHELAELIGEELAEEEELATTSGFVTHRLGGFPKRGDVLELGQYRLHVEEMSGPKVSRLILRKLPPPAVPPEDESSAV